MFYMWLGISIIVGCCLVFNIIFKIGGDYTITWFDIGTKVEWCGNLGIPKSVIHPFFVHQFIKPVFRDGIGIINICCRSKKSVIYCCCGNGPGIH